MRLLNHRTTSIQREDRVRGEIAGAKPMQTQRPELLPFYRPHLSYKSPLRCYAYNKSGKRGLRADQVTCGMNRNTLTQKAPHVSFSSPLEHAANPILSGEMRNLAVRCSGSHHIHPAPAYPAHEGNGHGFIGRPHGHWTPESNPNTAHSRARAEAPAGGFTGHHVFREGWALPQDAGSAPAGRTTPEHRSSHIPGGNPAFLGPSADIGVSAKEPLSEPPSASPQPVGGMVSTWQIPILAVDSAHYPHSGRNHGHAPACHAAESGADSSPGSYAAAGMVAIRVPHPSAHATPSIQGMIHGAADTLATIANLVLAAGQTQASIHGMHPSSAAPASAPAAEAPKDAPVAPSNPAKPGFSIPRARKTAQLIVARAENPPPE
jgi:hypothetical protein